MPLKNDAYGRRVLDFVETVGRRDDFTDISQAVLAEMEWFGLARVTAFSMPGAGNLNARDNILLNTRPADFVRHYIERNYLAYDPVISELRRNFATYSWSDVRRDRNLSKLETRIFDEASEFGFVDGLIVPFVTRSGTVSLFCPCGADPDLSAGARMAVELIGMASIAALAQAREKAGPVGPPHAPLTPREREIMHWVAAGRTDEEIAGILAVSTRTVTWHLENAKRKLDAYRRSHAVVQALRLGEISL
jgi:LuxR family quorum sensing-dependent transcriptional regulator